MKYETVGTEGIKRSFSRAAVTYERYAFLQEHSAARLADIFCRTVGVDARRVLEIGAGSGLLTRRLLLDGIPPRDYTANDLTDAFAGDYARWGCRPLVGDASSIGLPTGQQAVVSANCFQWIKDLPRFFAKLHDCLEPGGVLCFSTFGPDNFAQVKRLTGCGLDYFPAGELSQMLEKAGFSVVDTQEEYDTVYFDTAAGMLRYFSATGVNGIRREVWTPARLKDFEMRYTKEFGQSGRLPLTVDFLWFSARKMC